MFSTFFKDKNFYPTHSVGNSQDTFATAPSSWLTKNQKFKASFVNTQEGVKGLR